MSATPEQSATVRDQEGTSSSDTASLLRSALIVALVLAIPTLAALLPRSVATSWQPTSRLEIRGDTWDGNLVTDGTRAHLMSREEIAGFWGVLYVRSSADGGRTWGEPVRVSAPGGPSAARHSLTVGPDGSLWAAWSERGPETATQRLMLRRSRDGGATWEAPVRVSPPVVGLVGIPAIVMTPEVSLAAFTDGERGTVIVQMLDAEGAPTTDPETLRSTTRELYDDEPFFDAGLSAGAVNGRIVVLTNGGDGLRRATAGGGQNWIDAAWYPGPAWAPPRLAVIDGRMTALATMPTGDGVTQLSTETSTDGGRSWQPGATWHDAYGDVGALAVAPGQTVVLWGSCDAFCSSPVIRLGQAEAADGKSTRIQGSAGRLAGALLTGETMIVAWIVDADSGAAEERTLVVATGPRP